MAKDIADLKVCIFDVFGTVVDWRSSLIAVRAFCRGSCSRNDF